MAQADAAAWFCFVSHWQLLQSNDSQSVNALLTPRHHFKILQCSLMFCDAWFAEHSPCLNNLYVTSCFQYSISSSYVVAVCVSHIGPYDDNCTGAKTLNCKCG